MVVVKYYRFTWLIVMWEMYETVWEWESWSMPSFEIGNGGFWSISGQLYRRFRPDSSVVPNTDNVQLRSSPDYDRLLLGIAATIFLL